MPGMPDVGGSLVTAFDYVWERFRTRLDGLGDAEYLWEPVPGSWSVREHAKGAWGLEGAWPPPEPAPVTTIAWRVGHLAGQNLGGHGDRLFRRPVRGEADLGIPGRVADLPAFLDTEYGRWRAGLAAMGAGEWGLALGPDWGLYAESTRLDLALHVYDEVVHHAAEVGLLRDLYAVRHHLASE
jgi:hypothetical protein